MALPHWDHVIGYEEGSLEIRSKLPQGYPRFVYHPWVEQLARRMAGEAPALPLPSREAAEICQSYVLRCPGAQAEMLEENGIYTIVSNEAGREALKRFWQHTGLIVTSRQAQAVLEQRPAPETRDAEAELRRQIAIYYDCKPDDVFLHPTGMASMFDALAALRRRFPGAPSIQTGFPYVDSYKLQEEFGDGVVFVSELGAGMPDQVGNVLIEQSVCGCFCEVPGNPMLGCPDLNKLSPILREHRVPLVVDDTIATPFNVDVSAVSDLTVTSLTKFMTGAGDVTGGALICNPASPYYDELKPAVEAIFRPLLWPGDAEAILPLLHGFPERMRTHNANGQLVAERLRDHPLIDRVWYPEWEDREAYDRLKRPDGGYGALMTFLPHQPEVMSPRIYDALRITKGPSLGTVFSLACPFTLLAHYNELDWVESCGVSRYLIRISVGIEDGEQIWQAIEAGLHHAET